MSERLDALGLDEPLLAGVRAAGIEHATALQADAVPMIRRGGNAVLHAARGSGVVGAYGWGVLGRLSAEGGGGAAEGAASGPRALILVPLPEDVGPTASSLAEWAAAVGLRVAGLEAGWSGAPALLVSTPQAAMAAVRAASLKLEAVQAIVIDGLSTMLVLGSADPLETLLASVARDAQRVIATAEVSPDIASFVERHARKALNFPARQADGEARADAGPTVGVAVVGAHDRISTLARVIAAAGGAIVYARSGARAHEAAASLRARGFDVVEEESTLRVDTAGEGEGTTVSYDPPFDAGQLSGRHARGGVLLAEPREMVHVRQIAAQAGAKLEPRPTPADSRSGGGIAQLRDDLTRALENEDLGAELLVLAPLLEHYGAADVAAAAVALLRSRAATGSTAPADAAPPPGAPSPKPFVRLFFGIGNRDGIRTGDLLGAITGEARVTGDQVGRIELRDTFSVVEVASDIADRVIQALNGTSLRGRSLRVDYDRKGTGGGGGGGPSGPRRRPAPGPRRTPR